MEPSTCLQQHNLIARASIMHFKALEDACLPGHTRSRLVMHSHRPNNAELTNIYNEIFRNRAREHLRRAMAISAGGTGSSSTPTEPVAAAIRGQYVGAEAEAQGLTMRTRLHVYPHRRVSNPGEREDSDIPRNQLWKLSPDN
jgi:hypothetical protein